MSWLTSFALGALLVSSGPVFGEDGKQAEADQKENLDDSFTGFRFDHSISWNMWSGLEAEAPIEVRIPRMMTWNQYGENCAPVNEEKAGMCPIERSFCAVIVLLCRSCCYDAGGVLEKENSMPCGICSQVVLGIP